MNKICECVCVWALECVFACVFVRVCVHSKKDLIFRYSASVKLTEENELDAASKDPVGAFGHS